MQHLATLIISFTGFSIFNLLLVLLLSFIYVFTENGCRQTAQAKWRDNPIFKSSLQIKEMTQIHQLWSIDLAKQVLVRSSQPEVFIEKVFWKYAANLQENAHAKV